MSARPCPQCGAPARHPDLRAEEEIRSCGYIACTRERGHSGAHNAPYPAGRQLLPAGYGPFLVDGSGKFPESSQGPTD